MAIQQFSHIPLQITRALLFQCFKIFSRCKHLAQDTMGLAGFIEHPEDPNLGSIGIQTDLRVICQNGWSREWLCCCFSSKDLSKRLGKNRFQGCETEQSWRYV